jgi:hypothetical protein
MSEQYRDCYLNLKKYSYTILKHLQNQFFVHYYKKKP